MLAYGLRMQNERIDPCAVGRYWSRRVADLLRGATTTAGASDPLAATHRSDRVLDVRFDRFMADPLATVASVLEFAEHRPEPEGWAAIRAYLAANPRGKHGSIVYDLADFGLDAGDVERMLGGYRERFALPADV
jgi:hypothetical protein